MVALFSRRLRISWEFTPGLPIWRLHPPVNNHIIGEVRDTTAKRVTFFALNAVTGSCLWRDRELHDAWWVAIERVAGDKLVLHGFSSPDMPVVRGATVVDIPRCEVTWKSAGWDGDESALAEAGVDLSSGAIGEQTRFPIPCDPLGGEASGYGLASSWPIHDLPGPLEYLECGRHAVAAGHIRKRSDPSSPLMHVLKVHQAGSGKVVYEDTLAAAAHGIVLEGFFVHAGMLYYIRERQTLCAVKL